MIVTLKGISKGGIRDNFHIMNILDVIEYGIEVRKWVGAWLEVLVD